jgi:hypothetical protein
MVFTISTERSVLVHSFPFPATLLSAKQEQHEHEIVAGVSVALLLAVVQVPSYVNDANGQVRVRDAVFTATL